ncbi:hypothetical protein ANO14919_117410 [Xylariales sp. No.14919]|nr:hypothetical protein ANO14919_117410 [Xylariales sp. No.14919]
MSSETGEESTYHVDPRVVMNALEKIRRAKRLPHAGSTTLCKLCLDMSTHTLRGNSYAHIPNLWNLPIAAASCSFCSLVEHCIRAPTAVNQDALDFAGALRVAGIDEGEIARLVIRPDRNLLDLCFIRQGEVEEELLTTSTIRLFTDSPLSANREEVEVPLGMIVPLVPDLSNVGDLVKTWMEDCRLNHLECNAPEQAVEARLPTRVLDIDQVHRTGRLRLLHTNNIPGKYIALSHSWGGHQPAKTVGSNLVARCSGFPLSELPPTFRDAIAVAIQIDIMDRQPMYHTRRPRRLEEGGSDDGGRPRISTHTAELPGIALKTQDSPTGNIYACQRRSFTGDVDDGLLNRRAWVLQERVLSPRTLHFTEHQVYWECWQYHQGEDLEYEYLGVVKKEAYPVQLSPSSLLCDAPRRSSELPRAWWHISSEYSSLGLTFQTDKLVAISGLVQKLESQLHMTYMKGVWRELLHPSVLWSARAEDLEYLPLVGAPSWSWASRKGPIHFMQLYDYDPSPNFTVREADPISSSSGSLFVHGALAKLKPRLRISDVRWSDPVTDQVSFPPEIDYHAARYRVVQGHEGDILGWITLDVEVESQNEFPDLFWVLVARDSHLHRETRTSAATPPHEEGQRHFYILVQKNADGSYKRVGVSSMGDARYLDYCNESALIS